MVQTLHVICILYKERLYVHGIAFPYTCMYQMLLLVYDYVHLVNRSFEKHSNVSGCITSTSSKIRKHNNID